MAIDLTKSVFSPADRERIEQTVKSAEAGTIGEIVVMVVSACDDYRAAALRGGLLLGVPLALLLTPPLGRTLWLGPQNIWLFLALFTLLFGLGYLLVGACYSCRRLLTPAEEMAAEVRQGAEAAFFRHGLHRTRAQSGVLIFVALFERRVQVLADRGIQSKLTEQGLQALASGIASGIGRRQATEAICSAVAHMGRLLAEHFPRSTSNPDELRNLIIER